jgi:protein-disulfide isomerase
MLIFSDFQCPFCKQFAQGALPEIRRTYVARGQVLLAFDNLPLTAIHPRAMPAAMAAECARRQQLFWPMHDQLFVAPSGLEEADLRSYARAVGVDQASFDACVAERPVDTIETSMTLAKRLGISGTPTILIGTLDKDHLKAKAVLQGARSFDDVKALVDPLLRGL